MKNAIVGQSGGPTAAINATLAGVISGCKKSGDIDILYGSLYGIDGVIGGKMIDLFEKITDEDKLHDLMLTPAAALGSCRHKLPAVSKDEPVYKEIFNSLEKKDIGYFFYIGGNDSMDTINKLSAYAKLIHSDIKFVGVPKTIDNDLSGTDHTPGFGSAAKYIATSVAEMIRDTEVYETKVVTIIEIMGRDAGWLTASSAVGRLVNGTEPDLVYLPEVTFNPDEFIDDIKELLGKKNNVVVAMSEGIKLSDGHYFAEGDVSKKDAFGHTQLAGAGKAAEMLVKEKIGCKVRSVEINILQRCASHIVSKTDIEESLSIGEFAVKLATSGNTGCMAAYRRKDNDDYICEYSKVDLSGVANVVRSVPLSFINDRHNNVTDECLKWILPLIGGEMFPEYDSGLPKHIMLK